MEWLAFFASVVFVIILFWKSARKQLLILGALIAVSSLAIFILVLIAYVNTSQNYSDFTQFATAHEVQTYFEGRIKVGQATQADVQALIDTDHIRQCEFDTDTGDPELSGEIICTVGCPGGLFEQATLWSSYSIRFFFAQDRLVEVYVIRTGTSL